MSAEYKVVGYQVWTLKSRTKVGKNMRIKHTKPLWQQEGMMYTYPTLEDAKSVADVVMPYCDNTRIMRVVDFQEDQ